MSHINFYLKSTKVDKFGRLPVIAQINVNYKKYRKHLGKVRKSEWNGKNQRLKLLSESEKKYNENLEFNQFLDKIEKKSKDLFYKALLEKRKPSESEIRELFFKPSEEVLKRKESFFNVFEDFINSNKADKAKRTIMGYTTILNYLKEFEFKTDNKITWENLNLKLLDALKMYHYEVIEKQTGYFAKVQRVLKTFLKWAEKRQYYVGKFYEEFEEKEPEKEVIFLTLEELFALYNYDFKNERLNKTKDLFCFSCFTGLRFSDVISLKREHITDGKIYKAQEKTNELIKNPINDFANAILEKYKDLENPLPQISTQKLNEYIKECCQIISLEQPADRGFNKTIIKRQIIGGKVKEESIPKWKAITFHTGRKTFITNSIMLGMNIKVLQEMGAPKKEKDLKKYLKIDDAFKSEVMNKTWNMLK